MQEEKTSSEPKRGCGFRQVGKLYLIGEGIPWICPSLPLIFKPCKCCDYEPPQYRDFQWITKTYTRHIREPTGKACHPECPICYGVNDQDKYGLMWVGKKFYTPIEFITEAEEKNVCKAIKQIPSGLVLGETWVLLAHPEAIIDRGNKDFKEKYETWLSKGLEKIPPDPEPKPPTYPGIFYAFIPQRVEILVYKSDATTGIIQTLKEKGITPIIVPDKYTAHAKRVKKTRTRKNIGKVADNE